MVPNQSFSDNLSKYSFLTLKFQVNKVSKLKVWVLKILTPYSLAMKNWLGLYQ